MSLRVRKNRAPPPPPGCPLTEPMTLLRGAWTCHVVWNLTGGPRRFGELRADIPQISAKVLSARLRAMETSGVVSRTVRPTSPPSVEYALTELGAELVPLIEMMVNVGTKLRALQR